MGQQINKPTQPQYASPYDPQMSIDAIVRFFRSTDPTETVNNGLVTLPVLVKLVQDAEAGLARPSWAGSKNLAQGFSSVAAENVIDSRAVAAGTLVPNNVLLGEIRAYIDPASNHGAKSLRLCTDADTSGSLLATFNAGQSGVIVVRTMIAINAASPHTIISSADLNDTVNWIAPTRGQAAFNVASIAMNLQTRAWVQDNRDSIIIDSCSWTLA